MYPLTPGHHTFHSDTENLTFEYIIQAPTSHHNHALDPNNLLIIQCPAWGIGSNYLQAGLHALLSPSTTHPHAHALLFFHPRGTDGSSRPETDTHMSSMHLASDIENLRRHLGIERIPALLGHSNGGGIALVYAELYPHRVEKLILLNHRLIGFDDGDGVDWTVLRMDPRYRDVPSRGWKGINSSSDEVFTQSVMERWPLYFWDPRKGVPDLVDAIGERRMSVWCFCAVNKGIRDLEESGEMVNRLEQVQAKTLIIFGREDWICRVANAERTHRGIPGSELRVYENCGHFPWIEQRERTLNDIRTFLDIPIM
ncbi:hypothetical protein EYZ11_006585 [Aspergillus tanneri]|uniref:AB hydrolase-1 domain-containing protein n=1 Tax=Aspergillus tanneri TaxID=1220188 RepID=A0A4S3JHJ9_9EURO|nr:uncharacterized protein ATNIH1004_008193 [Aspergillus tanneri]KAA8643997.1 hypothetical protein ATNIH1004_008193 [Aspergillus tanneri]THC93938.1 hypothetical protein EYZ11_006585 [Aspergillus tanneri]